MTTVNFLQIQNWENKRFLTILLSFHFGLWGVFGLDVIGLHIPLVRQLICFIYLTFIPGYIILKILKLHDLSSVESLLYAVGLSLTTIMFTGLFMNTIYPLFGVNNPLSTTPLIITISVIVLLLCALAYMRDKDYSQRKDYPINIKEFLSPQALFFFLIPLISIIGTVIMNNYNWNILLLILILVISTIAIFFGFKKSITDKLFSLSIFSIALSLLFHHSLITDYISGWDIHYEYYLANIVMQNSLWDPNIAANTNGMLSVTMLSPIYSMFLNLDIIWVFKIIYPFLFAFVPLGLYVIFKRQTNAQIAWLSCFFFISFFVFYTEMLQLARQMIAEFFLVLLILVIISKNLRKIHQSFFLIIFSFSLIVSHYGTSYIFLLTLVCAWVLLILMRNTNIQQIKKWLCTMICRPVDKTITKMETIETKKNFSMNLSYVLIFFVLILSWYIYVSGASNFSNIIRIGNHISLSFITDFLNPSSAQGLAVIISERMSVLHEVARYIHFISIFFIAVGILSLLFIKPKNMNFKKEYAALSFVSFLIAAAGIAVPFFASELNTERLYHMTLIFLAPFCITGGIIVLTILYRILHIKSFFKKGNYTIKALSIFLFFFLLFNSGWVYQIADDGPTSIALDKDVNYPRFNSLEVVGAHWWNGIKNNTNIYADGYRWLLLAGFDWYKVHNLPFDSQSLPKECIIYLGSFNIKNNQILVQQWTGVTTISNYVGIEKILDDTSFKFYANGGSEIFCK